MENVTPGGRAEPKPEQGKEPVGPKNLSDGKSPRPPGVTNHGTCGTQGKH